ncbi:tetratricopeptide repeat protein [Thalassobaculum sp. OXR-137]|uniref:tetratricopeptide repeat protein n=1 Tax=Thalassobaculum sp. OXR-137 TaxID=3100173 RepID=UPI002AC91AD6|nr:tetratricopeptide repeat protein [Thalassobaculum sp. OXR-137]WPZ37112.1 tetratricopeptide repeat protein [Thalassobaculum sp. OXR-137]
MRLPGLLVLASLCVLPLTAQTVLAPAAMAQGSVQSADAEVPVPRTYGEAMNWYREAADAGDPKAMFYLGLTLEQGLRAGGDPKDAIAWYRKSADKGFALAQFKLGQLYQFGQIVKQDSAAAREWYGKAADQGLADAQYNLAVMLETGEGGAVDAERALALYHGAADGGIPEAFLNLAGILAQGELVDQDLVEALKWLILADRAGLEQGESMSAAVRQLLNAPEIADAETRADRWLIAHGERNRTPGGPQ